MWALRAGRDARALEVKGVDRVASVDLQSGEAVLEGSPDVDAALLAVKDAGYVARQSA